MTFDPIQFEPAAQRFKAFFDELRGAFQERDDVLRQIELALLAREHVILTGPPGTAKSELASATFGRIVDETTGRPSLYSRQIGESTVRTDLVGPLDFRTLMETGRSEHFTDEGMLGAVHAFLDEVFDGRDMLLRDALNVLQERELKQGSRVVRGRIECALMTSNRYLSEVLEESRETLLAFVDRIAFAGFVPRGFADDDALAKVLKRHVARAGTATLDAPLSVQNIDVLQAATESVAMSDATCERLALLLRRFDAELLESTRADASFVPTRYVSTRTAVRAGKLLRAIAVRRKIFDEPDRPLVVRADDFRDLYLHLVLAGPAKAAVDALLAQERDPRERRQLVLLQTERLIFDRCVAGLPAPADEAADAAAVAAMQEAVAELTSDVTEAIRSPRPDIVLGGVRRIVAGLRDGRLRPDAGRALLDRASAALLATSYATELAGANDEGTHALEFVDELARLADDVESLPGTGRALARSLRGRALAVLDEAARFSATTRSGSVVLTAPESLVDARVLEGVVTRARARLVALRELHTRRETLRARGADPASLPSEGWQVMLTRAEEELRATWDEATCVAFARGMEARVDDLARALGVLRPICDELSDVEKALCSYGIGERFRARVLGPRMTTVFSTVFERLALTERSEVLEGIRTVQQLLVEMQIGDVVEPSAWARWTAGALLATDRAVPAPEAREPSYEAYRALRSRELRTSNAYALAEAVLRGHPALFRPAPGAAEPRPRIAELLSSIPTDQRDRIVELDLGRSHRAVSFLEAWWEHLDDAPVESIVGSRFVEVAWDDGALLRFALELRTLAELFPSHATKADGLRARAEAVHDRLRSRVSLAVSARADASWKAAFPASVRT